MSYLSQKYKCIDITTKQIIIESGAMSHMEKSEGKWQTFASIKQSSLYAEVQLVPVKVAVIVTSSRNVRIN